MNAAAAARAGRSVKGYKLVTRDPETAASRNRHTTLTIPYPRLSTNWEQHALAHFFDNYVSTSASGWQSYLGFLPEYFAKHSDTDCLKDSVLAASMASLANISCIDQLQIRSRELYGRALQSVGTALKNPAEAKTDLVLTSIFLLQKYEARAIHVTKSSDSC